MPPMLERTPEMTADEMDSLAEAMAQEFGHQPEDALDDLVYDIFGEDAADDLNRMDDDAALGEAGEAVLEAHELDASEINNEGMRGQIRALLGAGIEEARIRATIQEALSASPAP